MEENDSRNYKHFVEARKRFFEERYAKLNMSLGLLKLVAWVGLIASGWKLYNTEAGGLGIYIAQFIVILGFLALSYGIIGLVSMQADRNFMLYIEFVDAHNLDEDSEGEEKD